MVQPKQRYGITGKGSIDILFQRQFFTLAIRIGKGLGASGMTGLGISYVRRIRSNNSPQ